MLTRTEDRRCHECGLLFVVADGDTHKHIDEYGDNDFEADAHHVAYDQLSPHYPKWRDELDGQYDAIESRCIETLLSDIQGRCYYDAKQQSWFEIVDSSVVLVSFRYHFGVLWKYNHHELIQVKRCSNKAIGELNASSAKKLSKVTV